jgi:hypothetical protein
MGIGLARWRRTGRFADHVAAPPPLVVAFATYSLFRNTQTHHVVIDALRLRVIPFSTDLSAFQRRLNLSYGHIAVWLLVHRTTFDALSRRRFCARRAVAGLPVERRIGFVYVLAGVVAALAAIISSARLGRAKADAAPVTNYLPSPQSWAAPAYLAAWLGHGTLPAWRHRRAEQQPCSRRHRRSAVLTGVLLALSSTVIPNMLATLRARRQISPTNIQSTKTA